MCLFYVGFGVGIEIERERVNWVYCFELGRLRLVKLIFVKFYALKLLNKHGECFEVSKYFIVDFMGVIEARGLPQLKNLSKQTRKA